MHCVVSNPSLFLFRKETLGAFTAGVYKWQCGTYFGLRLALPFWLGVLNLILKSNCSVAVADWAPLSRRETALE